MGLKLIDTRSDHPSLELKVIIIALLFRIFVALLTLISNALVEDYDTSSGLLFDTEGSSPTQSYFNRFINGFIRWDAVHFLTVAYNNGYTLEHQFAFFPGLPFLIRWIAGTLLKPLNYFEVDHVSSLALAGILISNLANILATWVLFKLTQITFKNQVFALITAILYACTPTPVVMSSIYTESMFSLLAFSGLYFYHLKSLFTSAFIFALSTLVRSNGILFVGYFVFEAILIHRWTNSSLKNILRCFGLIIQCSLILAGFLGFQYYAYSVFCTVKGLALTSPWCSDPVPLLYPYVQKHYWDCGFLRYYQISQLPNFLLASPLFVISCWGIAHYAWKDPTRFFTLGLYGNASLFVKGKYF